MAARRSQRAGVQRAWAWLARDHTAGLQLADRLDDGPVSGDEISATVSAWVAQLGAGSPLVDDLSRAVSSRDWLATHTVGERLAFDISTAA